jgi:hypothetical protein
MIQVGTSSPPVWDLGVALRQRSIRSFRLRAVFGVHMSRLIGAFGLALCAVAALPAAASAATWTAPLARCYVSVGPAPAQRQVVTIGASGFTPLAPVDVLEDGVPADATDDGQPDPFYADPAGAVNARVRVPYVAQGARPFSLSVTEHANPANTVSVTGRVTALAVTLQPAKARPSRRVRFQGRGFIKAAPVWAHYLYKGTVRRTVRLVRRPAGACGAFTVHQRQIPVVKPKVGRWLLQVDQQRAYAATPDSVFVRITITVGRHIKQ